jgi:hypothetical protein
LRLSGEWGGVGGVEDEAEAEVEVERGKVKGREEKRRERKGSETKVEIKTGWKGRGVSLRLWRERVWGGGAIRTP